MSENLYCNRYYMGRHKIYIIDFHGNKKALIEHLEKGFVGKKKIGYKDVKKGDIDIVLIRHCHNKKREVKDMGFKDMMVNAVNVGSKAKYIVYFGDDEPEEVSYIQLGTYLVANEHDIENIKIKLKE